MSPIVISFATVGSAPDMITECEKHIAADEEVIDPAAREQILAAQNAEYEASTSGADRWRDRLAQRHRFGRTLDLPPRNDWIERGVMWAAFVATLLWLALAMVMS